MKRFIIGLVCGCLILSLVAPISGTAKSLQREGIAYGNVLAEGWSCIYPPDMKKYRRRIVNIQINQNGAFFVYANGSKRSFSDVVIINNETEADGGRGHWDAARSHHGADMLVLKGNKRIHCYICGYNNNHYLIRLNDNKVHQVHRDNIRLIYPDDTIPIYIRQGKWRP